MIVGPWPIQGGLFAGSWMVGPVNNVIHTSWVAVVTPTDRPKSVCNCCVIKLLGGVFLLLLLLFIVGVGVCVI